jgi:hypothetical protein
MGWNLKQRVKDHIVTVGLGLITLLLLIAFRAIPSSTWDRVSEATPKRALWALLGLALIAICLLSGALIDNWRKTRRAEKRTMYGVRWDRAADPFCPVDDTLMHYRMTHANDGYDILKCPKCGGHFPLRDEGRPLSLGGIQRYLKGEQDHP